MMMNDGVDDEIEDSSGDDEERRWWKWWLKIPVVLNDGDERLVWFSIEVLNVLFVWLCWVTA